MESSLIESTEQDALLSPENIQNASALLALLHGKSDSISKFFYKEVRVDSAHLCSLNSSMIDKLSLHNVSAISTTVDIVFENKNVLTFKSWSEFEQYDFAKIISPTKSIFIQWDFFLQLAHYKYPQRHTVSIRITSSMNPSDMLKIMLSGALDDSHDIEIQCCTMLCRVDFINNTLAEELITVAEKWNELCESAYSEKGSVAPFIVKHAQIIADISAFFFCLSVCVSLSTVIKLLIQYDLIDVSLDLVLCTSVAFIPLGLAVRSIGKKFGYFIYKKAQSMIKIHIFDISEGDKKKKAKIAKESNYAKELLMFILNIVISFVISYFFWKI